MIAWRITKPKFASQEAILSGEGAMREGGRWNEVGLPLVYASENSSLAILENLVHLKVDRIPKRLAIVSIDVPDDAPIERIGPGDLPGHWKELDNVECVKIGSAWIRAASHLVLRTPSAVNPLDRNILLNPGHPDIKRCRVGRPGGVGFDPRFISLVQL